MFRCNRYFVLDVSFCKSDFNVGFLCFHRSCTPFLLVKTIFLSKIHPTFHSAQMHTPISFLRRYCRCLITWNNKLNFNISLHRSTAQSVACARPSGSPTRRYQPLWSTSPQRPTTPRGSSTTRDRTSSGTYVSEPCYTLIHLVTPCYTVVPTFVTLCYICDTLIRLLHCDTPLRYRIRLAIRDLNSSRTCVPKLLYSVDSEIQLLHCDTLVTQQHWLPCNELVIHT